MMIFLVRRRSAENTKERRKKAEENHWKMKIKKNGKFGESQTTAIYIFRQTPFILKLYVTLKHIIYGFI